MARYRNGNLELLPGPYQATEDYSLSAFFDRENNLWVGTDKSGLQRWVPRKIASLTTREGLAHENVWSVFQAHDGSWWVGTDGGVTQFRDGGATILKRQDGSTHKDVRAMAEDLDGTIWVGTMRSLECIRNSVSSPVKLPGEWFEEKIRALQPGRDGSMWVGTVRGLTRLFHGERTKYTTADGLGSDEVRAILEDRSGDLWVGTLGGGLSRLHEGRFTTLTTTNGLSSNDVWSLDEDSDGVLWAGTDNGLNRVDDGRITAIKQGEGLPELVINSIISDDLGGLWIGLERGICRLDRQQLGELASGQRATVDALQYDETDGMPSAETNGQKSYPSACKTRDGRLFFPTTQGVAIIDPAKLRSSEAPPLSAIKEVRANGRQMLGDAVSARITNGLDAGHESPGLDLNLPAGGARVLEFRYTANTFVAPEKARFKYRLVGLDDNWIEVDSRREAYFTDLHPGSYRFELLARNHRGVWQKKSTVLTFLVNPFFHQTWWFRGACLAIPLLLAGIALRWRARESQRISRLERSNALNEQRRRIAQDIHDELGASLTHIRHLSDPARRSLEQSEKLHLPNARIASIAEEMNISPSTVRTHVWHIYRKLQVHNRTEAVLKGTPAF